MRKMKSYKVVSILLCVFMFVQALPMDVFASAQMTGMTQESVSESDAQTSVSDPQIAPSEINNDPMSPDQGLGGTRSMYVALENVQMRPEMLPNVGNTYNGYIEKDSISYSFANQVFVELFDTDIDNSYIVSELENWKFTANTIKNNFIQFAKMGDVIQGHGENRDYYMIFIKATDQSVLFYDCINDLDGKYLIKEHYFSYVQLADMFTTIGADDENYIRILRANNYLSLYEEVDALYVDDTANFSISGGTLIAYNGNQPIVVIPETVSYIGLQAFLNNQTMQAVVIPSSVTGVNYQAFQNCTALKGVTFPNATDNLSRELFVGSEWMRYIRLSNKITSIPEYAFAGARSLTTINIPNSVDSIGAYAFSECSSLRDITLPRELSLMGEGAFYNSGIESVFIPKHYAEYAFIQGAEIGRFEGCSNLKKVHFAKDVTRVPEYLFKSCDGLETLTLPNSIQSIGSGAFQNADNLKTINLPESLIVIGTRAFKNCDGLEIMNIPERVTNIYDEAFSACTSLKSVYLPKSLDEISDSVFEGCSGLEEVVFPQKIDRIEDEAFKGCNSLKTLDLPKTLTLIDNNAFYDCDTLETVKFPDSLEVLGNEAFSACDALTNVSFGTGLKSISREAFAFCDSLKSIVLPYQLKAIGFRAFASNQNLQTVRIPKSTTNIDLTAFDDCNALTIEVYRGSQAIGFAVDNGINYRIIEDQANYLVEAEKVSFDKSSDTLKVNGTYLLRLNLAPANCTQNVVWTSSDDSIASVNDEGLVTGIKSGTATIFATVGNKQAHIKIIVKDLINDIQLTQTVKNLYIGETDSILYSISPKSSHDDIFMYSGDDNIASVDDKGIVTAKSSGSTFIYVCANDSNNVFVACRINVVGMEYHINTKEEFQSAHPYAGNTNESYVYSQKGSKEVSITFSEETFVEDGVDYIYILDKNNKQVGKYTGVQLSKKKVTVKGDTIKVRLVAQGTGSSWGFSVVSANKPFLVLPTSIKLNYTNLVMKTNTQAILKATVLPKNSVDRSVRYESTDPRIVSVENGVLTAHQVGYANIWAYGYRDMEYAVCTVEVAYEVDGMWVDDIPSQSYTGKAIKPEPKVYDGKTLLTLNKDYKLQYQNNVNAGNIYAVKSPTIIVKGIGNYSSSLNSYFEIQPIRINSIDVNTQIEDVKYTGKVNKSKPVVTYKGKKLVPNKDYTLEYMDLYDTSFVGLKDETTKIQVVIKGKGNYVGSRTIDYDIIAKDVQNTSVLKIADQIYTGSSLKPEPAVQYKNGKVVETLTKYDPITQKGDYTLTYLQNVQVGTAKIIIKGKNEFGGSKTVTFKIKAKPMSFPGVVSDVIDDQFYSPDGLYTIPNINDNGVQLVNGVDYTASFKNIDIAKITSTKKATVVIKGKGNYTGEKEITFNLYAKPLTKQSMSIVVGNALYNSNKTVEGKVVIKDGGKLLKLNKDYKLMYEDNGQIGTAKVVITGVGNYSSKVERDFQVCRPVQMSDSDIVVFGVDDQYYSGQSEIPNINIRYKGLDLTKGVDYKVSYTNTVQAANLSSAKPPTIKITGMGIYKGTITRVFTIMPYEMTDNSFNLYQEMSINIQDCRYVAGKPAMPKPIVKFGTTILKENVDYRINYTNNTQIREADAVNPPTITISGIGNYTGSYAVPFRIYEKSIDKLSFSKISAQLYTGSAIHPKIIVRDTATNTTLVRGTDYTVSYLQNTEVGYGEVIITGKGTYGGTKKIRFIILPKIFKWFF